MPIVFQSYAIYMGASIEGEQSARRGISSTGLGMVGKCGRGKCERGVYDLEKGAGDRATLWTEAPTNKPEKRVVQKGYPKFNI